MLRKYWPLALLALLVGLNGYLIRLDTARKTLAATQLQVAQKGAQAALLLADKAIAVAKSASDSADLYQHSADSLRLRGDSLERRVASLRGQVKQAALTAPDTCAQFVELAVVTIDSLAELAETRKAEAESAISAVRGLTIALDTTQAALNKTRLSLGELGKAADLVEHASRPSLLPRLLPKPGYGATAGIDAFGKPNAVVGFTLSWSF